MKRTCCSHKDAYLICINSNCISNCAYVCSVPNDKCQIQHYSCQLINIQYLHKKASFIVKKQKQITNNSSKVSNYLYQIMNKCKQLLQKLQQIVQNKPNCERIIQVMDMHGLIQQKEKKIISQFANKSMNNKNNNNNKNKSNNNEINLTSGWIQKSLVTLNIQISQYLKYIKNNNSNIVLIDQIDKATKSRFKFHQKQLDDKYQSNYQKYQYEEQIKKQNKKQGFIMTGLSNTHNINNKNIHTNSNNKNINNYDQKTSPTKMNRPTPVKSKPNDLNNNNLINSNIISNQMRQSYSVPKKQKLISSNINNTRNLLGSSNGFEPMLLNTIRNHVPIGPFFSKITNDIQTISTFFYQKINGVTLLYRASQNNYSALKFHQKCDNHKHTITILINEYDKIIGGYTPLPWKNSGDWYQDETQSSFIFNLTSGQRFPIKNRYKAIWCSHSYGPSFGAPDLQISDKANINQNSCVNFPQCYNNGNYHQGTGSITLLSGTKSGHFKIKQWEVYQLEFAK